LKEDKTRPNILHIFVDQLRFDCIGALGYPYIRTPALDRLVSRGSTFTNAYTPCPVCIPARCSMIYGQYPHNTGCYENSNDMPTDGRYSFMKTLSESGYRTHGIGKCHFYPDPLALRGFQTRETQEEIPKHPDDDDYLRTLFDSGYEYITDPHGVRGDMYYIPQVSQIPQFLHPTQWVGDRTVSYIETECSQHTPWYVFASFIHPHPPFSPPSPWHKLYGVDEVPLPHIPLQHEHLLTYVNHAQNRYKYRDQGMDLNLVRLMRAYYYACISFIDYQVGRIIESVNRIGSADNTLIIFTSDHGEYLGDYGCFGKRGMHDVSARIPMILFQPGVFDDQKRHEMPVSLIDLAPTICCAAGCSEASTPTHEMDGLPLQHLLDGTRRRDFVFSHLAYTHDADGTNGDEFLSGSADSSEEERAASSLYMSVSSDKKYIYSAPDAAEFLYDRLIDPLETRNRAKAPHYREETAHMRSLMIDHLQKGGEEAGIDGSSWVLFQGKKLPLDPDYGLLIQNQPWINVDIEGYSRKP